jgi:hypothetical protein
MPLPQDIGAFCERYAAFLVASIRAFDSAGRRVAPLIHRLPNGRAKKPWKAVLGAAMRASARPEGVVLEFGVFRGKSCRFLARRHRGGEVHGFDSFEGFPDDGRRDWRQTFAVDRMPKVPGNATLHKGYFEDTLPAFLAGQGERKLAPRLVHIDCDLFSSTRCVLNLLGPHLGAGDILVFDELINYDQFLANEFLALFLFLERRGLDFAWCVTCGAFYPMLETGRVMLGRGFQHYRRAGYYQNQAIRLSERAAETRPPAPDFIVDAIAQAIEPMIDAGLLTAEDLSPVVSGGIDRDC